MRHTSAAAAFHKVWVIKEPILRLAPAAAAFAIVTFAACGWAYAADAPKAEATAPPPTPLTGIVVAAPSKTPPAVVEAYPASGASVSPGALVVKIKFDQRMNPNEWRFDRSDAAYPQCLARPRLLNDEKTFVLLCTVGGAGKFSIALNSVGDGGFANLAGQRATAFELTFSTSGGASLGTIQDAMKAAGLKPEDDPVMDKKPATALAASIAPAP